MEAQVKTFMAGSPIAIEAGESALAALDLMIDHGIRHLPVIEADRRVVGLVSFDDLRAAFPRPVALTTPPDPEARHELGDLSVGEVMTYAPVTATVHTPLEEAATLLAERRIGCLPVLDADGRLDGIITETDLLQALVTLLWTQRRGHEAAAPAPSPTGLLEALQSERAHILERLRAYEAHEREITERRREGPLDRAEEGAETTEAEFTEELAELAVRRLRGLEHALERAGSGKLGVCERCGGRIPAARLRALPGTTQCIRCAKKSEASG